MGTTTGRRAHEVGFVHAYLLAAIALFSLMVWAASQMFDANNHLRWVKTTADIVFDQSLIIRKQVIACGTEYPAGMSGGAATVANQKYPATTATGLAATVCPGAPADEAPLWSGRDGVFLRKLGPDFATWSYENGAAGIVVTLQGSTPRGVEVLTKVVNRLGAAEASMVGDTYHFLVAAP